MSITHKPIAELKTYPRARRTAGSSFAPNHNPIAALALAAVAYALVPFLGILFCPGAIFFGGWGVARARREPHADGFRAAFFSLCAGLLILCVQLLLWWMLRRVTHWTR